MSAFTVAQRPINGALTPTPIYTHPEYTHSGGKVTFIK
jgi:hypothetical protein